MHWKDKKIWAVQEHRWANALSSLWSFVADRMIGQEKKRKFTNCPRRWTLRSYEHSVEGSLQFLFHWIFIYLLLCTAHFHERMFLWLVFMDHIARSDRITWDIALAPNLTESSSERQISRASCIVSLFSAQHCSWLNRRTNSRRWQVSLAVLKKLTEKNAGLSSRELCNYFSSAMWIWQLLFSLVLSRLP